MGKELIFKTMRHEPTERIPWVPFSGIHSGKLKGYTAEEKAAPRVVGVESEAVEEEPAFTPADPSVNIPQSPADPVVVCNNHCDADSVISDIWKFLSA